MIIDFHVHCYPPEVAKKLISRLNNPPHFRAYTDGTIEALAESMKRAGIDISLNLPVVTNPASTRNINKWAAENNKAPVYSLGSIHPDSPEPADELKRIKDSGLKGIKLHPEFQLFSPLEKRMDAIWENCIENELFVLLHAGGSLNYPGRAYSNPSNLAELHEKYPELILVLAHMGSFDMWDEVEEKLCGKNVYFDLAYMSGYLEDEKIAGLIGKHGADKVIFGSDCLWRDQKTELEKINSLPLGEDEKEKIFFQNAKKLLNL